ncbi:M3 family metallopeptidase [Azospirillum sp.]|uniref:M3 family metallopeptidase n=1 Tax=Azospirillum sp. TaxID=34012 RepID=UPI002D3189B8|nr:M3 family metallopeptidase [Azospirillum sp.]HYD65860.1 M3 family metallopeptidase [Azospirillum sp.]
MTDNPFFEAWTTPFGLPPFDRIAPEHFPPAFDQGMAEQIAEVEAITASTEPPTFANTVEAMERSGRLLTRVSSVFFNLNSSNTSDALEAIARDYAPKLAQHHMRIALDPTLFARIADLFARRDTLGLATDQMRLIERMHLDFIRSGAGLEAEAKARMSAISERLATLHTLFNQNVLHDEKEWHLALDEGDLDGLPGFARDAAAGAARERGLEGRYVITLSRSSVEPFLTFSARRDLRQTVYEAWNRRGTNPGEHDNTPLIREIVALRAEQARLLGYATYADYKLDDAMAKTTGAVENLLLKVWEPAKRKAAAERDLLQAQARAEGLNAAIEPWDWRYYAEKVRQAEYDLDEAEVKPYFVLDNMVRAAFDTATRLFGVTFAERDGLPVYHPDVRVYEVRDAEGAHVGLFLHDNFARAGKRSGAWMSSYRDQESFDGPVAPIIVNNSNFAKGSPTLLSFDEAETLFHEFGHGLHGLLSKVRYPSQSGTSVRRDFVEFPSQVYEHWMAAPETLRTYAVHHETGEPIPEDLLKRLLAARTFNQGFATVEYTAAALLDLAFHTQEKPDGLDVAAFEREVLGRIGVPAEIGVRHRPAHFQHLFGGSGYAAGYYCYLWAEVLDADGFEAFKEAGNVFDPTLSAGLKAIYSSGDTRDPMDLYVAFRGRAPEIEPLLKHRGLVDA